MHTHVGGWNQSPLTLTGTSRSNSNISSNSSSSSSSSGGASRNRNNNNNNNKYSSNSSSSISNRNSNARDSTHPSMEGFVHIQPTNQPLHLLTTTTRILSTLPHLTTSSNS
ncbi:hypothetical protein M0802_016652 [Mischocyttarus mexicanus]|nr:hypothetical protein M0802_016652 [Mischocyttarus mexicanus]